MSTDAKATGLDNPDEPKQAREGQVTHGDFDNTLQDSKTDHSKPILNNQAPEEEQQQQYYYVQQQPTDAQMEGYDYPEDMNNIDP